MADLLLIFNVNDCLFESMPTSHYSRYAPRAVFGIEGQPVAQHSSECTDTLIHLN